MFYMLPFMLYSQSVINSPGYPLQFDEDRSGRMSLNPNLTDLTISPDSLYFIKWGALKQFIEISNHTNQPINLLHVQSQSNPGSAGWGWWVDSISVSTPHFIYPGQFVTVAVRYWTIIKDDNLTTFLPDSMYIVSSVGTQFCHIFLDPSLISSVGENVGNDFLLFPNPGCDYMNIYSRSNENDPYLVLWNTDGKLVLQQKITVNKCTIQTKLLPDGIYTWQVLEKSRVIDSGKWIKRKMN